MPEPAPSPASADRNLLFGILALQMDFISRDALIRAMHAWVLDKYKPLGQILVEQGGLAPQEHALVEAVVHRHVHNHGGDPQRSLAAVSSIHSVRQELAQVADPDLQASLALVSACRPAEPDPNRTSDYPAGTPAAAGTPTTAGQRFRVVRPHARGGLGEVFVARDEELHRDVALKEIQGRFADDPRSRARFLLEAEVTGGLEHPGVVPVYGLGAYPDGRPFYAMRLIQGDSLKDAIQCFHAADGPGRDPGERRLALRGLLGRFVAVCNAVAYAHSRGVLHRDLKPSNVMLGPYGETLVVDWGLAKVVGRPAGFDGASEGTLRPPSASGSDPTQVGAAVGTPAYMSPEQAAGRLEELGPASDVYSLGATLYCLLTGKAPVEGQDAGEILRRVQRGDFAPPRAVKPGVSAALEAVCLKAMALQPEGRYGSARALAGEVEHWLAGEPVLAYPEPWTLRARRWLSRHRTLATATAAALCVATLCLALTTLVLRAANERERTSRAKAEENFRLARDAVDRYYTKVSTSPKLKSHGLEALRRELLLAAKDYYEKFVAEEGAEPDVQLERGLVYRRLAQITAETSSPSEAIRFSVLSRDILQQLAREHPHNSAYSSQLAKAHSNLGLLYQTTGKNDLAKAALEEAMTLAEQLAGTNPAAVDYQDQVARAPYNLARLTQVTGQTERTRALFETAQGRFEQLAREHPDVPDYQDLLGRTLGNLGLLYANTGKQVKAKGAYEASLSHYAQLAAKYPEVPDYQNLLNETN
jgi:serine/threonine-protein kinase